ncbi:MAG: hypothetical protein AB1728_09900 [Bacteroidota bacterium]
MIEPSMTVTESDREKIREHRSLFWDVDPEKIDLERNANYVIERFLEYGTLEGVRWLRKLYGDERIKHYILQRGYKTLSNKTLNFWKLLLNLEREECLQPSSLKSSRKYWNY